MFPSRTISVQINRPLVDVYAFAHLPENFLKWASGLATTLHCEHGEWVADTPAGQAKVCFTPPNLYGVLDHAVRLASGFEIYIPLRAIANGEGTEVSLTLFRFSQVDDAGFERDAKMVEKDLATLKGILEA